MLFNSNSILLSIYTQFAFDCFIFKNFKTVFISESSLLIRQAGYIFNWFFKIVPASLCPRKFEP